MHFTSPLALVLLLLIPAAAWVGWPQHGFGRQRDITSLILRILIIILIVCSLAGLNLIQPGTQLAVVFLLDRSDSMPEDAQLAAIEFIQQAVQAIQPGDQAALIVFGSDALVERSMSATPHLSPILSIPATHQTDLEEAIRLAMAIFPADSARRLVILSDGIETSGDASAALHLVYAAGIEVVVLPFQYNPGFEALLSRVDLPANLSEGESFFMEVSIQATSPISAAIQVTSLGEVLYRGRMNLRQGEQTYNLPLQARMPGFIEYQVLLIPDKDTFYQNNELSAFTEVTGPPHILVIAPPAGESMGFAGEIRPDEYSSLVLALQSANYFVDIIEPYSFPMELSELARYASLVLVDVPAQQLNLRQMESLRSYVRDLGGGLVTIGGPTSYGVGGYFRTPLEEMLPVDIQLHDQERRPSLAIAFIIDHSGSMSETYGNVTKLELAQEAAIRSIELLFPSDRVGVIAFDDSASWVVPMTDLTDPQKIIDAIGSIRIGGGTDILAGIQAMSIVLPDDPALVKHVILLTDGGADPTGIPELVSRLYNDYGITLTTIGVGRDAAPYLADLAALGGGRYSFTADPSTIPSIFTQETILATRAYIVEETTYPELSISSPMLSGIDSYPPLAGYIATSPRETAQTILVSHLGDPILAAWQYGLGRVVSFTSDAASRWAQAWVTWDAFPVFWSQAVEYTLSRQVVSPLQIQVAGSGEDAFLLVDALETSLSGSEIITHYWNDYSMQANLISPSGYVSVLDLYQIAPGQYQALFQPSEQGVYLIQVNGQPPDPESPQLSGKTGWVLDYSPEYQIVNEASDVLYQIGANADGNIASADPADIFKHNLPSPRMEKPVWPWLLMTAAFLLPIDIAVRRLVFGKEDLRRMWGSLRQFFSPNRPGVKPTAMFPRPVVQGLLTTKARVHNRRLSEADEKVKRTAGEQSAQSDATLPIQSQSRQAVKPGPLTPEIDQFLPDHPAQSTASRLLARKRVRRDRDNPGNKAD